MSEQDELQKLLEMLGGSNRCLIHTVYLAELCETQARCNDDCGNAFLVCLKTPAALHVHDNHIVDVHYYT